MRSGIHCSPSPRVEDPADINLHYCQYVAETVVEQLDADVEVEIVEDGGRGFVRTWIVHDGRHYDAECVEGVSEYLELPFFRRHPEAAIQIEPATADAATLRQRGMRPLYPEIFPFESPGELSRLPSTRYWKYALAGVILGGVLTLIGLSGEWALHRHLLGQSAFLRTLFIDLEILGEMILLVSPAVFFVLLPSQRADPR